MFSSIIITNYEIFFDLLNTSLQSNQPVDLSIPTELSYIFDYQRESIFKNVKNILNNKDYYNYMANWVREFYQIKSLGIEKFVVKNFEKEKNCSDILIFLNQIKNSHNFENFSNIKVSPEVLRIISDYIYTMDQLKK